MKTFISILGLVVALALANLAGVARAQNTSENGSVSFQTFYDQLAGQGTWIQSQQYGNVWQPNESDPNWRPYAYGHWVNTDQGMAWDSDEPFGWATYHYGRWTNLDGTGWVWVPGYTWAPAWVSWRDGDDEVGWAPLPPASDEGIDYYSDDDYFSGVDFGFHIGNDCDVAYGIGPAWYNFCPIAYIGDRDCYRHFRDHRNNFAFIGRTRNFTNINFHRDGRGRFGHVRAEGPSVASLNARANHHIENAQLAAVSRPGEAGLRGNRLDVFAPRVDGATFRAAHPSHTQGNLANAAVNRGTDINRPLAVNSHVRTPAATSDQLRAAAMAQGSTPANARIATPNTQFSRNLDQPLTSMRTHARVETPSAPRGQAQAGAVNPAVRSQQVPGPWANRDLPAASQAQARHFAGTPSASRDSRFTGEGFRPQANAPAQNAPAFRGNAQTFAPAQTTPVFHRNEQAFAPGQGYQRSQAFSAGAPPMQQQRTFQRSAPAFQSPPAFQRSAPAYHPQQTFRPAAPMMQQRSGGVGAPQARSAPVGNGGGHANGGGNNGQGRR